MDLRLKKCVLFTISEMSKCILVKKTSQRILDIMSDEGLS